MIDFTVYKPAADSRIFDDEALPKTSSKDSEIFKVGSGGQNGGVCLYVKAASQITLAETKKITIEVKTSADGSDWVTLEKKELSAAPTDEILDYVFPPSTMEHCKVTLTTDDANIVGSVNAYLRYLPR